jgi:ABC-type polysaccharide/polyol phosphate transport system ATPase subunit
MQNQSLVSVRNVTLSIPVFSTLRESLTVNPVSAIKEFYRPTKRRELRQIIRGVSFDLAEGDRLALIGANGSGKTTMLRLLSGVLQPTGGSIVMHGNRQALLNLSMGMNGDATGLENIYLSGFAMGLSAKEINERIEDIVSFSELGEVIQDPINTYSAGMKLRLAFATVTSQQSSILLLDEWLSAGDQSFMDKAKRRLVDRVNATKVLVLASHSESIVKEICNKGIVMKKGRIAFEGDVAKAYEYYRSPEYWAKSETVGTSGA